MRSRPNKESPLLDRRLRRKLGTVGVSKKTPSKQRESDTLRSSFGGFGHGNTSRHTRTMTNQTDMPIKKEDLFTVTLRRNKKEVARIMNKKKQQIGENMGQISSRKSRAPTRTNHDGKIPTMERNQYAGSRSYGD